MTGPIVHDDKTYDGCVYEDSCISHAPSFVGELAEWACENNDILTEITDLGVVIVISGFAIYYGGPALIAAGGRILQALAAGGE